MYTDRNLEQISTKAQHQPFPRLPAETVLELRSLRTVQVKFMVPVHIVPTTGEADHAPSRAAEAAGKGERGPRNGGGVERSDKKK